MNTRLSPVAASLLLAFSSVGALGADTDLEPVIVTATRSPMLLEHSTGEVAVVTRKEIEARNPTRLTDTINTLPGVFSATGKGILQPSPGLALRGIPDDRRTLILLDGIPLTDGFSSSALLGGIPVDGIAQAEVLYGPMSSLYGGNAMGGVINFVTAMPKAPEFGFRVGYGNPFESGKGPEAVRKTSLNAGTRLDNDLAVRFAANWAATDGYRGDWVVSSTQPASTAGARRITLKDGTAGYLLGKKGQNDWEEHGASLKLEQRLADGARWRLGWMLQEYDYGYGTPQTYLTRTTAPVGQPTFGLTDSTQASFAGNSGAYSRQLFHAGFDSDLGIGRLNVLATYSDVATNSLVTPTGGATSGTGRITQSPSQSLTLDTYWNAALGSHDFTGGIAYREDKADSREYSLGDWSQPASKTALYSQAAGRTTLLAGYLQDNWQVLPRLILQGGLRYDHWSNENGHGLDPTGAKTYVSRTESAWSPKLGAAFRASSDLTLRASAGSAFRAPSIYDLYRSSTFGNINTTGYRTLANPALKPETVTTWELGADWKPWNGGELKATYFHNDIQDLIYLGPKTGSAPNISRSRINAGKAESEGVTLALVHRFDADNRVFANYTRTRSRMLENAASAASVGKQLTFMPDYQASAGFERRHGPWTTSLSGRYASKQYSADDNSDATGVPQVYDAYFVADAKVSYRFDKQLSLSLAVDNLLNREYFSYYAAPGRSWFAELSYQY